MALESCSKRCHSDVGETAWTCYLQAFAADEDMGRLPVDQAALASPLGKASERAVMIWGDDA